MTVCDYKMTDEEKRGVLKLIKKRIPPYASSVDYYNFFAQTQDITITDLMLLCRYFACNITQLPNEMKKHQIKLNCKVPTNE